MTTASGAVRRVVVAGLLAAGLALPRVLFGRLWGQFVTVGPYGPGGVAVLALVAVAAGLVLPRPLGRVRRWIGGHRRMATVLVVVASAAYLYVTAVGQGRSLRPYVHDEFSYLIQAHQFATGHLWERPHPLGAAVDSFQLFVSPAYASAYFPGTAILYVPGVWLHGPAWVTSLCIAAAVAGLLFHITVELIDPVAAVVAVLLLWADGQYRGLSTMVLGQMPLLLMGLIATAAWLAWRTDGRRRWAAVVGTALAWAAVTRPLDAVCFGLPIGVAVLGRRPSWRMLACFVLPGVPFLAVQLTLDRGITGHWAETPFRLYADRDYPGTAYGFHPYDPAAEPASPLPQKRALYNEYRPLLREHTPGHMWADQFHVRGAGQPARLPVTLAQLSPLPFTLLTVLLPAALVGLNRRRAVGLAVLPLFVVAYAGYAFFFSHYTLVASAAVIWAVLIGGEQVATLASGRWRPAVATGVTVMIAGLAVGGLPQVLRDPSSTDDIFPAPLLADVDRQLSALGSPPAVVLFTYDPKRNTNEEPVYTVAAWPDDAAVVRLHDLGPAADRAAFRYYADRQPGRVAYRYDEAKRTLTRLGRVTDLTR